MKSFTASVATIFALAIAMASVIITGGFGYLEPEEKLTTQMEIWQKGLKDPVITFKPDDTTALIKGKVYRLEANTAGHWGYHDASAINQVADSTDYWVLVKASALTDREFTIRNMELVSVKDIDHRGWWGRNFGWAAFWN